MVSKEIFFGGVLVGSLAPLWRGASKAASYVLAAGALVVVASTMPDLLHPDAGLGESAIHLNRQSELLTIGCELAVAVLAWLAARRGQRKLFWGAWLLHTGYGACVLAIVIWLTFFWHW